MALSSWLYVELGFESYSKTVDKRNLNLLFLSRFLRLLAFGLIAPILVLHLRAIGFADTLVGQFLSLTLLGDVLISFFVTWTADRLGRRNMLILGAILLFGSGLTFALEEAFVPLLLAAVLGVVSPSGNEVGPFQALELAILSEVLLPEDRVYLNIWYQVSGTIATALGSFLSGVIVHALEGKAWETKEAYHAIFAIQAVIAILKLGTTLLMTSAVELHHSPAQGKAKASTPPQTSEAGADEGEATESDPLLPPPTSSAPTPSSFPLKILLTLAPLFALDAFASSLIPQSFIAYYLRLAYHSSLRTISATISVGAVLATLASFTSGWLSRVFGIVNTMVWTHAFGQVVTILVAFAPTQTLAITLLLVRMFVSTMDSAPKMAFVAAILKKEHRVRVMGVTNILKSLASSIGPSISGYFASRGRLSTSFILAGAIKLVYDFSLLVVYGNVELKH